MKIPFVTHAFIAGTLAPAFHGRVDLDKYDLGVAAAENFYVDFRGGLASRPGTRYLLNLGEETKIFDFRLRNDQFSILVLVGEGRIRLFQDSDLLLADGAPIELAAPFVPADFASLQAEQVNLSLYFTCPGHPPQKLEFFPGGTPEWTFGPVNFLRRLNFAQNYPDLSPAQVTAKETLFDTAIRNRFNAQAEFTGGSGSSSLVFTIGVVDSAGVETVAFAPTLEQGFGNYTVSAGRMYLTWDNVPGADFFRVYRSSIVTGAQMDFSQPVGLIGEVRGTSLLDDNIVPDYTRQPPQPFNPFANGAVLEIEVTAAGSGYDTDSICDITSATGEGFAGYPIVRNEEVQQIRIVAQGKNYKIGDTVSIDETFADGSGFSGVLQVDGVTGAVTGLTVTNGGTNYRVTDNLSITSTLGSGFAGTLQVSGGAITGLTIAAGGTDYDVSDILSITRPTGTGAAAEIVSLSPESGNNPRAFTRFQQHAIYAGTDNVPGGIWGSRRGVLENFDIVPAPTPADSYFETADEIAIDPIEHLMPIRDSLLIFHPNGVSRLVTEQAGKKLEEQAAVKPSKIPPLKINNDVVFPLRYGSGIHALTYTFYTNSFSPQDLTVLASHYFDGNSPTSMTWLEEPDKLVWVSMEDGKALTLTYLRDQEVFAWTRHQTQGMFQQFITFQAAERELVAAVVKRDFGSGPLWWLEQIEHRTTSPLANYWGVDAGISGSFETAQTTVSGLAHLEGQTVSVLADGDAILDLQVVEGSVTLPDAAQTVVVGLPFECLVETLPLYNPQVQSEGKRKRIVGSAVRLQETRGLEIGTSLSRMYEMKDRGYEDWGEFTALRTDKSVVLHAAKWERDARIFARQRYPLPATILGLVTEAEVEG